MRRFNHTQMSVAFREHGPAYLRFVKNGKDMKLLALISQTEDEFFARYKRDIIPTVEKQLASLGCRNALDISRNNLRVLEDFFFGTLKGNFRELQKIVAATDRRQYSEKQKQLREKDMKESAECAQRQARWRDCHYTRRGFVCYCDEHKGFPRVRSAGVRGAKLVGREQLGIGQKPK